MDNTAAFWLKFFLTVTLFVCGVLMTRDLYTSIGRLAVPGEKVREYILLGVLVLVYVGAGVYIWLP